jgi:hypothetical protein
MKRSFRRCAAFAAVVLFQLTATSSAVRAEGEWEITPQSEEALRRGIEWLARNQGPEGNWTSNDLGLVGTGALAFMAAGHLPGRGPHGDNVKRALEYVVRNAKPSGLLNIADQQRDMYNHGLATFVLGQAYGMHGTKDDQQLSDVLGRALKLIAQTQCRDGGWDYQARSQERGHDLSLAVMQAKALRSAMDSGLEVPPEVIELAIRSVRQHYTPRNVPHNAPDEDQQKNEGQFSYTKGGGQATVAMAAAGVVCLQEFGQYDDWRIEKNMQVIGKAIREKARTDKHTPPFDAYTLYYVGQALYQVGGKHWKEHYPVLRDSVIACQVRAPGKVDTDGRWPQDNRVGGKPGELYMTSVACFILAMPNRYLPILQEGKIEAMKKQLERKGRD